MLGNAAASYGRFLLVMAVQFGLTPLILRRVGADDFGLWSLTFSVMGFLGLLDGGLATSAVKFVAECRGSGDTDRRNRILSTLLALYLLLALAATLAVAGLATQYAHWFSIPDASAHKAVSLLWTLALRSVVLALPLSLFHSVLFGEQQVWRVNAIQSAATVVYAAGVLAVLDHGGGIVAVGLVNLAAMALEYGAYLAVALRTVPGLRLAPGLADRRLVAEVASFSGAQLLVNVAQLVRLRTDPIWVQLFLGLAPVAVYSVALRIAESALLLIKQVVNVFAPVVAERHGAGDAERVRAVFVDGSRFVLAGAVAVTVPLLCLAESAVRLWVGAGLLGAVAPLRILLVAMALAAPQLVAAVVLVMTGHHRFSARAQSVGMVINVAVSVALARPLGLAGVALGTLAATLAIDVAAVLPAACRAQKVPLPGYVARVFGPALVCGALQAAVTLAAAALLPAPQHLWQLVVPAAPGLVCFGALFAAGFTTPQERAGLRRRSR